MPTQPKRRQPKGTRWRRRAERAGRHIYEARRREARAGLVHGPYLTERPLCSLTTAHGGAATLLRRKFAQPIPRTHITPRGEIREFSRKSRTRLQQTLCALPIQHVGRGVLFITLTYPAEYPGTWQIWKKHLDTWIKRLRRRLPACAGVWKLEPQKRGAPHFHLLLVGTPFIARKWLSRSWFEVVGSHDDKHLVAGTNVQLARSHRGVVAYAAKYVAKHEQLPEEWAGGVGRWWGVFNRAGLGIEWLVAPLSQAMFYAATRITRELVAHRSTDAPRAPPNWGASGSWCVLRDDQAARIYACVLQLQSP